MQEATGPASHSTAGLHAALLDYFGAPGRHQLGLRQPALLFASVREILQVAAGRGTADAAPVREAATFFLRAALLYPGADHYAVLGLPPRREPVELKERYRLLMRLIHPDFAAADASPWPADAAVRVNRAYEVLSSPLLRREYDEQLLAVASQRAVPPPAADPRRAPPADPDEGVRVGRKAIWAFAAGLGMLGIFILTPRSEPVALVQKPPPTATGPAQARLLQPESPSQLVASPVLRSPVASTPEPAPAPAQPLAAPPVVASLARSPEPPAAAAPAAAPVRAPNPDPAPAPAPRVAPVAVVAVAPPTRAAVPPATPAALAPRAWIPVETTAAPPAPLPASAPVVSVAPPPAVAVEPVPTPVAVVPPLATAAPVRLAPVAPGPTLADAQPLLTQLLQTLETGSGDQMLRLLDGDARHAPSARALSRQYDQLVQGTAPVRLSQVEFKGEPREGSLFVTGRVRLHRGEPTIGSHGDGLLIRAEFVSRAGKVTLKGLSGGSE